MTAVARGRTEGAGIAGIAGMARTTFVRIDDSDWGTWTGTWTLASRLMKLLSVARVLWAVGGCLRTGTCHALNYSIRPDMYTHRGIQTYICICISICSVLSLDCCCHANYLICSKAACATKTHFMPGWHLEM